MQSFFLQKKTLIIEMLILLGLLYGMYYLYGKFSVPEVATVEAAPNTDLLGPNLVNFLKATKKDNINFNNISFMDSKEVSRLVDHSENITIAPSRGRLDPFVPYASTRPLR